MKLSVSVDWMKWANQRSQCGEVERKKKWKYYHSSIRISILDTKYNCQPSSSDANEKKKINRQRNKVVIVHVFRLPLPLAVKWIYAALWLWFNFFRGNKIKNSKQTKKKVLRQWHNTMRPHCWWIAQDERTSTITPAWITAIRTATTKMGNITKHCIIVSFLASMVECIVCYGNGYRKLWPHPYTTHNT